MNEYSESLPNFIEQVRLSTEQQLAEFKKKFGVNIVVSLCGGSDVLEDEKAAELFSNILQNIKELRPAVLTGGTKGGIPELGLRVAKQLEIPTIGVFPPRGRKNALFDLIDLPIESIAPNLGSPTYGTETPVFAQIPDVAVVVGGGFGTLIEVSTMLKLNTKKIDDKQNPIYICPVSESGGVADMIPSLVELKPAVAVSIPQTPLKTGEGIASFIKQHLLYN